MLREAENLLIIILVIIPSHIGYVRSGHSPLAAISP